MLKYTFKEYLYEVSQVDSVSAEADVSRSTLDSSFFHVGKVDNYDVWEKDIMDANNRFVDYIEIFLTDGSRVVGEVSLVHLKGAKIQKNKYMASYRIIFVAVTPDYRGKNLGAKLYTFVINNRPFYLISDTTQSKGGVNIWKQLRDKGEVAVQQWNPNKTVYSKDITDMSDVVADTEDGSDKGNTHFVGYKK